MPERADADNHADHGADNYVWHFLDRFAELGDAEAVVAGERRLTYGGLHDGTLRLAATLREHGFGSGDGVAVLVGNTPEAIMLHLAAHLLGCRTVWIATAPRRHQRAFVELARVDRLIYDPATHGEVARELAEAAGPLEVFCLGPGGLGPDLPAHRPSTDPPDRHRAVAEPRSLFQTSGTTGRPKLVLHRQRLFAVLPGLADDWLADGRPVLRHLSLMGHWHVAGQMTSLMVLHMGGVVVLLTRLDIPEFLATIESERINSTVVSPPVLSMLLDHPALASTDHRSLRVVTCGGSATAPARVAETVDRLGPVLRIVYAMSESPGITELPDIAHDPDHPQRLRSAGLPYADVRLEIRDDHGRVLPAGETGEVWVSSSLVMDGYWGEPELTARALVDGWLRTGDVGHLDEDGYLYLVGRTSEVILTGAGSTNVYPRPIEDALLEHPEVQAAAVIGVPDEALGEAVHAYVVRAGGSTVTGDALCAHVADALNQTWAPREVEFADELPLNASGKVDRVALRAHYLATRGVDVARTGA
jgi:fatty-acyl-CoA synthase